MTREEIIELINEVLSNGAEEIDLGKVGVTPKGNYDSTVDYEFLDVVTCDGCSYLCLKDCTGTEVTNTEYWQLLAKQGEKPVNGVDYNTEEEKEEFKQAVVEDSKTDMNNYTETKKTELDTHTETKKSELDTHKSNLESAMTTTKDGLVEEIINAQDGFDENVTTKINEFNDNATEQTNTFNTNAEGKTTDFNNNTGTKITEYNNNHTAKIEEFDTHAEEKVAEFNENVDSIDNELTELAGQMPWNTTEVSESIHIEDSAKYSRNKLFPLGNLEQETREGYNLFNLETITEKQYITTTGVLGASEVSHTSNFIPVVANKTYTVFFNYETLANTSQRTYCLYNSDKTVLSGVQYMPSNKKITINPTEDGYLRFTYDINCTNIQCIEGTEEKEYEQYGAMPSFEYESMPQTATGVQTIRKCKKNLIPQPYTESAVSHYGVSFNVNPDYSIDINGTSTNPACDFYLFGTKTDSGNYLHFEKGIYSFKNFENENVLFIAREKTLGPLFGTFNILKALKNQDCYFYSLLVRVESNKTANTTIYPQLEKGDTATDYEPYSEEIFSLDLEDKELAKIKDTDGNVVARDKFVFKDEKWQIERNIKKLVLNGSENWNPNVTWNADYATIYHAYINLADWKIGQANAVLDKMKFSSYSSYLDYVEKEMCVNHKSNIGLYLFIKADRLETFDVAGLQKFLSENNLTIYYELAELTYENCTESQAEVLDKLHKLSLAQGTNNIFVESENGVTVELQLEYMQDRIMLENAKNKEFSDKIDALEEAILNLGGSVNV